MTTNIRSDLNGKSECKGVSTILAHQYIGWEIEFIERSFYLPVEILKEPYLVVEPIKVVSGSAFVKELEYATDNYRIVTSEGATIRMLLNAHRVGISIRHVLPSCRFSISITGHSYMVAKIWYGGSK